MVFLTSRTIQEKEISEKYVMWIIKGMIDPWTAESNTGILILWSRIQKASWRDHLPLCDWKCRIEYEFTDKEKMCGSRLALVEVALLWSCLATISNSSSFFNALMHDYLLVIRSNSNRIGISTKIPTKHTVAILTDEAENVNEIIILEVLCK